MVAADHLVCTPSASGAHTHLIVCISLQCEIIPSDQVTQWTKWQSDLMNQVTKWPRLIINWSAAAPRTRGAQGQLMSLISVQCILKLHKTSREKSPFAQFTESAQRLNWFYKVNCLMVLIAQLYSDLKIDILGEVRNRMCNNVCYA